METRKHLSLYLCKGEESALEGRASRAGWITELARRYLKKPRAMTTLAERSSKIGLKVSISLPADVAAGLAKRHPTASLAEVLRTLVLSAAGRHFVPADASAGLIVSVAVPAGLPEIVEGDAFDREVRSMLERAAVPSDDRMLSVKIPAEAVPLLERACGDVSPSLYLSRRFAQKSEKLAAAHAESLRPGVVFEDPRPYARHLLEWQARGYPENAFLMDCPWTGESLDELRRLIKRLGPEGVLVVVRTAARGQDGDFPALFHGAVVAVAESARVRCILRFAHVVIAPDSVWSIAAIHLLDKDEWFPGRESGS